MRNLFIFSIIALLYSSIGHSKEQAIDLCGKIKPCINDFKIEGMGVGDSLLDFFSKKEIKKAKAKNRKYKNNKYTMIIIPGDQEFDEVWISYRTKDKKYEIAYIKGLNVIGDKNQCKIEAEKYKSKLLSSWQLAFIQNKSDPNKYLWGHSYPSLGRNFFWGDFGCTNDGFGGLDLFISPQTETWAKWYRNAYIPGKS